MQEISFDKKIEEYIFTTNIMMLVNIDPIFGFMLGTESTPVYLEIYTVSAMYFIMGYLL